MKLYFLISSFKKGNIGKGEKKERVKKGNIGLKWVDNSGREIISIRNNATLIYGTNYNVINGITIFISEKFKGLCKWYFESDIAEFEFD